MKIEYYGYKDQERLDLDPEDVARSLMEDENYSDFPIKVHVFKQMSIADNTEKFSQGILENILENLDEEYSDPDGDCTTPTDNMKKASLELAKVLVEEYHVWSCERTGEIIEFSEEEARKIAGE